MLLNDIESLRFSYESHLLRVLKAQLGPDFPMIDQGKAQYLLDTRRKGLLGDAVRVTADLLPDIHEAYQSCLDIFGGGLSGELFVQQSQEYNANVFAHGRKFDVLIHSALLKDFTLDELRFVLGHELGHVVFEHSRFPVYDILANTEEIGADTANLMFRWARSSELSADRVGLLCCGKLNTGVTALFKTASGLAEIDTDRILRSFHMQYEELEKQIFAPVSEQGAHDRFGWVCTHPMILIRFKALELAALDIVSLRKGSKGFSWKGFRTVDKQIGDLLEAIDAGVIPR